MIISIIERQDKDIKQTLIFFHSIKDTYTANFDFLQSANTSCCSENNEQHLIKIPNHCVFIRNTNTIDYLKTFNLKDIRRVFNKMIYKELMKMGEKFANSYPMTKTKKIIMFL